MNRGYVKLWRKSLDAGWIRNHKLWAFWTYCLMQASHKEYDAIVGLQAIHLMPGQFIFGRKKAAEETGMSEREIRTILDSLKKWGNLTINSTNKYSIITIINWSSYQGDKPDSDQQNGQPLTSNWPHTNIKALKNKRPPEEISFEISSLLERYSDQGTIDQAFQTIASTRKTGRVAESVKRSILKAWERYPVESVMDGIKAYIEKCYADQGKDEKYLLGIIRNNGNGQSQEGKAVSAEVKRPSTGSALYDAYLRGEIKANAGEVRP